MMSKRQKRMAAVAALVVGLALTAVFGFTAFRKNMMYFYTPTDILDHQVADDARLRLGGLVMVGSVKRGDGLQVDFTLSDCEKSLPVRYDGILPDLFKEGQGIVATGTMQNGVFVADEVLAKHDENYMPPELAKSLKTADGKHSCAPFKSATGVSPAPRSQAVSSSSAPRSALRAREGTVGRADGDVKGGVIVGRDAVVPS
ncbi:cytochrome c maturation protein CcmE [Solimonas terrae]|uniref:Cytochrome c-type biogenesis protein CcmE n=1 Tax=Solimonas terrae TaxID=1396819 RepID=A0A6M2BSF6_9GAMM|nr:cytochrome c maturation protein CcmE [Solimonas terrae]NGY05418.1 cytochrome c maturation protein CcmE [Solimonas terrae]